MENQNAKVSYIVKETGEKIDVSITYPKYESVEEAISEMSEGKILSMINQTVKEDIGNNEREKAKVRNGHSTRAVLSEEEKAERREQRKVKKDATMALLQKLAEDKGIDVDTLLGI